jgi:hypothetical protein
LPKESEGENRTAVVAMEREQIHQLPLCVPRFGRFEAEEERRGLVDFTSVHMRSEEGSWCFSSKVSSSARQAEEKNSVVQATQTTCFETGLSEIGRCEPPE